MCMTPVAASISAESPSPRNRCSRYMPAKPAPTMTTSKAAVVPLPPEACDRESCPVPVACTLGSLLIDCASRLRRQKGAQPGRSSQVNVQVAQSQATPAQQRYDGGGEARARAYSQSPRTGPLHACRDRVRQRLEDNRRRLDPLRLEVFRYASTSTLPEVQMKVIAALLALAFSFTTATAQSSCSNIVDGGDPARIFNLAAPRLGGDQHRQSRRPEGRRAYAA